MGDPLILMRPLPVLQRATAVEVFFLPNVCTFQMSAKKVSDTRKDSNLFRHDRLTISRESMGSTSCSVAVMLVHGFSSAWSSPFKKRIFGL